jgi:hypothetical protein
MLRKGVMGNRILLEEVSLTSLKRGFYDKVCLTGTWYQFRCIKATLDSAPLSLSCPAKQWRNVCTKADQMRTSGTPALLIVEAHVGTRDGALLGVVKGIQVVEGKKTAAPAV